MLNKTVKFMQKALYEAEIALQKNCIPIGAVIVQNNKIVARAHNGNFWHAEILCIKQAQKKLQCNFLENCILFTTIKPCAMCYHASKLARIKHIIFGCDNEKTCLNEPEMIDGICENEAKKLMQTFFKKKREQTD